MLKRTCASTGNTSMCRYRAVDPQHIYEDPRGSAASGPPERAERHRYLTVAYKGPAQANNANQGR